MHKIIIIIINQLFIILRKVDTADLLYSRKCRFYIIYVLHVSHNRPRLGKPTLRPYMKREAFAECHFALFVQ